MADIKIVDEQGNEVVSEAQKVSNEPEATVIPTGVFLVEQLAQTFDLKPSEVSLYRSKLQTLIEYAKTKTSEHTPDGIKWAIRRLGVKVGTPPLGEKPITYLYRYAYLDLESQRLEREKRRFLNKNDNN